MYKQFFSIATALTLFAGFAVAEDNLFIGVVNFTTCITDSKYGKKEQENLENLRGQLSSLIENTEKELKEISAKFEDTEYVDSLSPKAEEDLKLKQQTLQEDLMRYQNQFYQVLNHANYQMIQKMNTNIAAATAKVAESKNLDYVINKEACFYIRPDLDVTASVIGEMDKTFEFDVQAQKKVSDNSDEAPAINAVDETVLDKAG